MTQRALGELLGVPQSWVYKCEAAIRRVDVAEFADWAEACGVEPSEVVQMLNGTSRPRRNEVDFGISRKNSSRMNIMYNCVVY